MNGVLRASHSALEPHISHIIQNIFQYDGQLPEIDVKATFLSRRDGSSAALSNAWCCNALTFESAPSIRLDWRKWLTLLRQQHRRAGQSDRYTTSALGGRSGLREHVTGTRHVFDTSWRRLEGSRNWAINAVDYLQILVTPG